MTIWRLRVDGEPQTKGSVKCIGGRGPIKHALIEDDKTGARALWRAKLAEAAQLLAGKLPDNGDDGVIVGLLALVERPASARGRSLPARRSSGDTDKHLRMTFDALDDAEVYGDDSRICLTLGAKAYADDGRPGAIVYVAPIGEDPHRILTAMLTVAPALTGRPEEV